MIHSPEMLVRLEQEMGVISRRIRRVIGSRARAVDPELSPGAYLVLTYLAANGACRSMSVVEALGIDKGAVSRQISHLMGLGLVERTPDLEDGRASLVVVTAVARQRLERVSTERRDVLDQSLAGWTDEELADFVSRLTRYNDSLEQAAGPLAEEAGFSATTR